MSVKFDKAAILAKYKQRADDTCIVVGAQSVTWAAEICPVKTSNLTNSLTYSTDKKQGSTRGKSTGKSIKTADTPHTVRIGTNVEYGPAAEFGYTGTDKLGRSHNRPAKSYLRASQATHKADINRLAAEGMRG